MRITHVILSSALIALIQGCDSFDSSSGSEANAPAQTRKNDESSNKIIDMPSLQYKPKTIPSGPKALTQREVNRRFVKWSTDNIAEYYAKIGVHSPKWDDFSAQFIKQCGPFTSYGTYDKRELRDYAYRMAVANCADPLLRYLAGNVTHRLKSAMEALSLVDPSVEELRKSGYPRLFLYFAIRRRNNIYCCLGIPVTPKMLEDQFRTLGDAAADPIFKNGNQRFYCKYIDDELRREKDAGTLELYNILSNEYEKMSGTDPWISHYVHGCLEIELAWQARGDGWASSVSEYGWKQFDKHLKKARFHLTKAQDLHPEFPQAASKMITLAMAGRSSHSIRYWFDKAVAAQFDYAPAYHAYLWALRPRWCGSHEKMLAFGRECLATRRFDTSVPYYFLKAITDIDSEIGDKSHPLYHRPDVIADVVKYFEGILKEPTKRNFSYWNTSEYCSWMLMCGNDEKAWALFSSLGPKKFRWKSFKRHKITEKTSPAAAKILKSLHRNKKKAAK